MFQSLVKKTSTVLFTSADEMRFVKDTEDCLGKGTALLPIRSCNLQAEVADISARSGRSCPWPCMKINKENRWTIEEIETELGHNYFYEINFLEAIFLKADWSIDFFRDDKFRRRLIATECYETTSEKCYDTTYFINDKKHSPMHIE